MISSKLPTSLRAGTKITEVAAIRAANHKIIIPEGRINNNLITTKTPETLRAEEITVEVKSKSHLNTRRRVRLPATARLKSWLKSLVRSARRT